MISHYVGARLPLLLSTLGLKYLASDLPHAVVALTFKFYVTMLGDQNLILGLPWLEKHNPNLDWKEKTLEFRNTQEDKLKAFIRSLAQGQEETMLIEDADLVLQYLKSHRGPKPMDQLTSSFEDIQ